MSFLTSAVTLVVGIFIGLMLPRYVAFDIHLKEGVTLPGVIKK